MTDVGCDKNGKLPYDNNGPGDECMDVNSTDCTQHKYMRRHRNYYVTSYILHL